MRCRGWRACWPSRCSVRRWRRCSWRRLLSPRLNRIGVNVGGGAAALGPRLRCNYTGGMSALHFEWDERKAAANEKKHGVSFEEAKSVFSDERAKLIDDPDHAEEEDRFILLGLSSALRVLVVCHCYR